MIHYKIYKTIDELPDAWDTLLVHDVFLQTDYLKTLRSASPKTISMYYVGMFVDEVLSGIAIIQRVELYAKDMFRTESSSRIKAILKDGISRILKGNILVVGNLMHTGQHGIYVEKNALSQPVFLSQLFLAIDELNGFIKNQKKKTIRTILWKDYFKEDFIHTENKQFETKGFYHVNVQPNMLLQIRPHWNSMPDYLGDLNTKYKTRFKRAKKKFGNIRQTELSLLDVQTNQTRIYELYKNVSNNARFNTFVLPENHFYEMKKALEDRFRIFGYYKNEELIGFYTLILNGDQLETYFLGYDQAHQYENQLYLNMLYDMIDFGINNLFKTIVYARTAMEIKSSVGAKPKAMSMYIKHTNPIINALLQQIFKLMNPSQQWEERNPFKNTDNLKLS